MTGAGGRLGNLLQKVRNRGDKNGRNFVFQSRTPGADLTWDLDDSPDRLPACDSVVALWGKTSGSEDELSINVSLAQDTRRVALNCGATRVFHLSSAGVYGPGTGLSENSETQPTNPYAASKLAMEHAVSQFDDAEMHHCCLRLANVVGADSLAPALRRNDPVRLDRFAAGGGPIRSYIAASDLLSVLAGLSLVDPKRLPPVLNVACPVPIAMKDLACAAGRTIEWVDAPAHAVHEVTLDASELCGLLPGQKFISTAKAMVADWRALETMT